LEIQISHVLPEQADEISFKISKHSFRLKHIYSKYKQHIPMRLSLYPLSFAND